MNVLVSGQNRICLGSRDTSLIKSCRIPPIHKQLSLPTAFILLELRSPDMTEIILSAFLFDVVNNHL